MDQLALRERPKGAAVMYQRWRSLLFMHFGCDPGEIQGLLPPGLEVDTFADSDGVPKAWVGLVPFRMEGVRPRALPPTPGLSAFPETNVRTYVRHQDDNPGVWFFSLDAANPLACRIARRFFALPYHEATMSVRQTGDHIAYAGRRRSDGAAVEVQAAFGASLPFAQPGTLEFFLIERYLLYSCRNGALFSGQVHHRPYPLRSVSVDSLEESLVKSAGVGPRPFVHFIASDGVDVEVFGLRSA